MKLKKLLYFFASIIAYSLQAMEQSSHTLAQVTSVSGIQKLILEYASDWEKNTPIEIKQNLSALAYSSDNRYLITGDQHGMLSVYDAQTNQLLKTIQPEERLIKALVPLPDGNCLVGADLGTHGIATLGLLNLQNKDAITYTIIDTKLDKILALAYSSTGQIAITYHDGFTLAKIENGKLIQTKKIKKHRDTPYALAFSPNGKYIATGSCDKLIKITETTNLNTVSTLHGHSHPSPNSAIKNIIWISDTQLISIGDHDLQVRIWDISNLEKPTCKIEELTHKPEHLVSVSPQQNYVMYRVDKSDKDTCLCILNLENKKETIISDTKLFSTDIVLATSPDGRYLAAGTKGWSNPIIIIQNSFLPLLIKQNLKKK
jgi:WD40 repeat protein